jgi:hypothetical protein
MNCPTCDLPMSEGTARIQGTFWRFLLVGASWMALFFFPRDAKEKIQVLAPWQDREARYCKECGAVVVLGL